MKKVFIMNAIFGVEADAFYEVTRKRTLRGRMSEILGSENPEEWDMDAYERLLADAKKLGETDDNDREAAFSELVPLAGDVDVQSVRRPAPHSIEVKLSGSGNPVIEYVGTDFMADIHVRGPTLHFCITEDVQIV